MLKLGQSAQGHEQLFVQHYERLLGWAMQIAGQERAVAEDLVHDAYVQFVFARPDLAGIRDLEAYLYGMLRNLHLSQVRTNARRGLQQLSVIDYDSAANSLRLTGPANLIQAQDELRKICYFANSRKEVSGAASVLLLRFFHGYYPSEIVRIARSTDRAVRFRLHSARAEVRLILSDPRRLSLITGKSDLTVMHGRFALSIREFLLELRFVIFHSRRNECLSRRQLSSLYQDDTHAPLEPAVLAHIVSCESCLDKVNYLLGLPALNERLPIDMLDHEPHRKDGDDGKGHGGGTGNFGNSQRRAKTLRRHLQSVFEHEPKEICIAVNGYIQGSQTVSSEICEQTLIVDLPEKISSVEVFSEQGVRLGMLSVGDEPPHGPEEQRLNADFSGGRSLQLTLKFRSPWPMLHVLYRDPAFEFFDNTALAETSQNVEEKLISSPTGTSHVSKWLRVLQNPWVSLSNPRTWLGPALAVLLLAMVMTGYLKFDHTKPGMSAGLLLQEALVRESQLAGFDIALHRTMDLEERSGTGTVLSRRRIDIWQSAERGTTARRLYDQNGTLVAGDWRRFDGVQTIYHHGVPPQLKLLAGKRNPGQINFSNVWQFDATARDFNLLLDKADNADLKETDGTYVFDFTSPVTQSASGLVKALLVLRRNDLHAIEQTLVIRQGEEVREYRFVEKNFERSLSKDISSSFFEPEPALRGTTSEENIKTKKVPRVAPSLQPVTSVIATPELELKVLKQLNQAGAFYGEQIGLSRAPDGRLHIEGIVETDQRKTEILQSLALLKDNPAIQIQVETVAEAAARESRVLAISRTSIELGSITADIKGTLPVEKELRDYFRQKGLSGEALDQEIRQYADRVMGHSGLASRHALALARIAERFSPEDLRALNDDEKDEWRAMMAQHARAVQQELNALRTDLQPIYQLPLGNAYGENAAPDDDYVRTAKLLLEIVASIDESVGRAFSINHDGSDSVTLRTSRFALWLSSAEELAERIRIVPSKQR